MVTLIFSLLAFSTLAMLVYSIVFLQLYSQRKKIIYLYFSIFTGVAIFWSLGTALMLFSKSTNIITFGYWLFLIAPMVSTLFILFFCQLFIKGRSETKYVLGPVFIVLYAVFLAINDQLFSVQFASSGTNAIMPNSTFYIFYGLYFIAYFDLSIFTLRRHRQQKDLVKYLQAKNIVYGTGLTGSLGIITNIFLPAIGITQYVWLGPIFSLFFLSFATIAIARYKLFDIRTAILRSTTYIFTIAILAGTYSVLVVGVLGSAILGSNADTLQWGILSIITAGIAVAFAPLHNFFNKFSNRLFYRDAYEPQELLDELNKELISNIEVDQLLQKSAKVINRYIKSGFCIFEIKKTDSEPQRVIGPDKDSLDNRQIQDIRLLAPNAKVKTVITDELEDNQSDLQKKLRKNDIAVLVRLTDQPEKPIEGIGHIVLGFKKSGNPYSSADIKILEIIADELVITIQNALRFEEIQNFSKTLQDKVDDATHKLRKANEKLVALDQTKDDFISMASHQLRTPLTSVKGYVSMVLEGDAGKVNEKQKELLNQSFVSSQRMVYLIADLLNVSRLRTGKFIIDSKPTNLADVVEGEISQLQETAEGRGLKLTYDKPKNFPTLMLDETKTRQVIMNFADNAIYYTPSGGNIKVVLEDRAQSVEFRVEDDGIGVPMNEQHHLFGKFYRAGNAKKARPDGTGLGLFMAKKVIVAQKGSIIFRSKEGHGSTFGFSFAKEPLLPENFEGFSKDEEHETSQTTKKPKTKQSAKKS